MLVLVLELGVELFDPFIKDGELTNPESVAVLRLLFTFWLS